ncbi:hypothetical protein A3A63_02725 [Candidatus Gottesmanbacteria bacterium RIFCSPLOWO2_01_FULL_46_9]|uniref:Phosphatidic acid phosphatase type 2/haloperoxidase domain-containing protein n=1 Tax=Candidatus Gottesmanbacteria bacterium RIFCSPLOWO2_01_FULL_46_9 TaxID=1798394 RepID=A0A1F6B0J4_9BACT|nr:MAG: hypothetical protein A3A63_02725 [Candidatus Gottesmanbacteria bacterium RIFCSPLOWO2_01_FULL_46_9]
MLMNQFVAFDTQLFLLINHLPHSEIGNTVAMFLSGIGQSGMIWFVVAICLFFREEKRDHWFFLPVFLSAGFGLALSEFVAKSLVLRMRPAADIGALVVSAAGNYSFPSTHATLAFALAYVLSKEEPKLSVLFYLLAISIGVSRIYLGVHYPGDVLGGAVLGVGIGYFVVRLSRRVREKNRVRSGKTSQ